VKIASPNTLGTESLGMRAILIRCLLLVSLGIVSLIVGIVAFYFLTLPSHDVRDFHAIRFSATRANSEFWEAKNAAESEGQNDEATANYNAQINKLVEACLKLAENHPQSTGELAALWWASSACPASEGGQKALQLLSTRIDTADLAQLGMAITYAQVNSREIDAIRGIAPRLLYRAKSSPSHPQAAQLLTQVCTLSAGDSNDEEPGTVFSESADLIATQYAASPDITNFCELLGMGVGSPLWATRYERHLRTILDANQDRQVRCAALMALASVVQSAGEGRQMEAEKLYNRFIANFDGHYNYRYQRIEQELRNIAQSQINELRSRGIGKPAPEVIGIDLNGQPMKLSDFRGKVVLISFWATWCRPCIELIPHEQALAARLENEEFAIVGVNGDTDEAVGQRAVATHSISWRSFRNRQGDRQAISDEWQLLGWPTLYLIDREGIVRKRWVGGPSPTALNHTVDLVVFGPKTIVE